jgi:hypothetical protein
MCREQERERSEEWIFHACHLDRHDCACGSDGMGDALDPVICLFRERETFVPKMRVWECGIVCQCDLRGFQPSGRVYRAVSVLTPQGIIHLDEAFCRRFQIAKLRK